MPPSDPLRTGRLKLPLGNLFWHEGGQPSAQGPAIVFLHGSWTDSTQWLAVMASLAAGHHCLAPDLLGFGESACDRRTVASVALQVEALHHWLSILRVGRCHLVAHSLGAWVAGQYALTHAGTVQSLTVIAPEGVAASAHRWRRDRWLVAPWSPLPLVLPWLGKRGIALRDRRRILRQHPAACQMLFQRRAAAIGGEQLQDRLEQLRVPSLVVESADPLTQRLGNLWLRRLPKAVHQTLPAGLEPLSPKSLSPDSLSVDAAALVTALEAFWPADRPTERGQYQPLPHRTSEVQRVTLPIAPTPPSPGQTPRQRS